MPTPPTLQDKLEALRTRARTRQTLPEEIHIENLLQNLQNTTTLRKTIARQAKKLAAKVRNAPAGIMQQFLNEYHLSSEEGIALMCLAEAYLRTPDTPSLDDLIKDKVTGKAWGKNKSQNTSLLLSASHWSLTLTGNILKDLKDRRGIVSTMQKLVQKLGEPVVRLAIAKAMKLMGGQFVLGETMTKAIQRAQPIRNQEFNTGYRFSYDMLGEAARCDEDAQLYMKAYLHAIACLKPNACKTTSPHDNCGISVKLSAIHPRYELGKKERITNELVPRLASLVKAAHDANIPLTLDAEEADRSDLLLSVLEATLSELDKIEQKKSHPKQDNPKWDGFGIVLQAYRTNTYDALDFVFELAKQRQRRIAVRLVKGAYWDAEIKQAQTLGVEHYPVFTRKCSTDLSYLACARKLMSMRKHIFPQFGTHNAHTATAILAFAKEEQQGKDKSDKRFELQRIHGMGEALHENLRTTIRQHFENKTLPKSEFFPEFCITTRIYAPVGVHQDLLAYLVRRMLENGANSSFVHQVLDRSIPVASLVEDPVALVLQHRKAKALPHPKIVLPPALFAPRKNARGWNLNDIATQKEFLPKISAFMDKTYEARSHLGGAGASKNTTKQLPPRPCKSPADGHYLGSVCEASIEEIVRACENLRKAHKAWAETSHAERAEILETFADLLEENAFEAIALLSREAGKTLWDGISEVREAVDFARFYANLARGKLAERKRCARGLVVCIAPWNFPLAIFCGQITAALACGNSVLAKPAEQTPLIADLAVNLLYRAGVPRTALACLFGTGERVGRHAIETAKPEAVCFTGSQETARLIDRQLATLVTTLNTTLGNAVLIAETGGINAMIVDSTALAEQVVRDVLVSAFQSSGQRCSALRLLFVQKDLEKSLLPMLVGAAHELALRLPWHIESDMGPLIDGPAQKNVQQWCRAMARDKRASLLFQGQMPNELSRQGFWMPPHIFRVKDTEALSREVFGPVLHVQTYDNREREHLLPRINAMGYGLTFGIHSRIDSRIAKAVAEVRCGNIYVNRDQIGAVVGCQPFGGEELSGTGPKAGGADILLRLSRPKQNEPSFAKGGILDNSRAHAHKKLTQWRSLLAPAIGIFDRRVESDTRSSVRQELWQEAPVRLARLERAIRDWQPASRACAHGLLAQAHEVYANDGVLPGTTGERNRLYTTQRGIVACCGERHFLSQQVLAALALGNRVVCAQKENLGEDLHDPYEEALRAELAVLAALAPREYFWQISARDFLSEGLRLCHAALFDGKDENKRQENKRQDDKRQDDKRQKLRARLAAFPDRRRLLLSLDDELSLLATQRVVSEDTTASGGNASLLLAASKG